MKGLLIKDICLLKKQTTFFLVCCGIAAFMLFTNTEPRFIVCYVTTIFSLATISTFSYDEYDNGIAFLFTLPVSRKKYVTEKFVLGSILCITTWCAITAVTAVYTLIKNPTTEIGTWILSVTIFLILALVVLAITVPLQLKFGAEKSRIALLLVAGVFVMLGMGITKIAAALGIQLESILNHISNMGMAGLAGIIVIISGSIMAASYMISIKIIEKKEY